MHGHSCDLFYCDVTSCDIIDCDVTNLLPDEDVVNDGCAAEDDAETDDNRRHDCRS